jgi:hypothetical protein
MILSVIHSFYSHGAGKNSAIGTGLESAKDQDPALDDKTDK